MFVVQKLVRIEATELRSDARGRRKLMFTVRDWLCNVVMLAYKKELSAETICC